MTSLSSGSPTTFPGGYNVIGIGYNQPEYEKISVNALHAYVTERTVDLVKVALAAANRAAATVVTSAMTAPQQLVLDEAHNAAYVVEYASPGRLFHVNLTTGVKTTITSALSFPVGLFLSSEKESAANAILT